MIFNKKRIAFVIVLCTILVFVMLVSGIYSTNIFHLQTCTVQNCHVCCFIHIAINIVRNITFMMIALVVLSYTIPIIFIILKTIKMKTENSLVNYKVQQNK